MWRGVRERRSGSAKFVLPLPPYIVPSSANSCWFKEIGSSCPSQRAQPFGTREVDINLSSPRKGMAYGSGWGQGSSVDWKPVFAGFDAAETLGGPVLRSLR